MNSGFLSFAATTILFGGLTGCATVSQDESFDPVKNTVRERLGFEVVWDAAEAEERAAEFTTEAFAGDEITIDEAIRVALLYNPDLQSRFEDLGIARARLIQATLLPNPVVDIELLFIEGGAGEILELTLTQSVIEALLMPLRRQVAEARLEEAQARLVGDVLDLVTETRTTYRRLQAQEQLVELYMHATDSTYLSAEMASRLREAGNVPQLEVSRERAMHEEMKQRLAESKMRRDELRSELALLMGLVGPAALDWAVTHRLPAPVQLGVSPEDIERTSIEASVDLRARRAEVIALGRRSGVERIEAVFPELAAGVTADREADGTWAVGPVASVPIPIFNWGQGASAEYRSRLRRAYRDYTAFAQRVRHTARARFTTSESAAARALHLRNDVIPLRNAVTQQTQEQFNAMQVGVFALLDAKRREIETAEAYIQTLREHWVARAEMESILLGRLPQGGYGLRVSTDGRGMPSTAREGDH